MHLYGGTAAGPRQMVHLSLLATFTATMRQGRPSHPDCYRTCRAWSPPQGSETTCCSRSPYLGDTAAANWHLHSAENGPDSDGYLPWLMAPLDGQAPQAKATYPSSHTGLLVDSIDFPQTAAFAQDYKGVAACIKTQTGYEIGRAALPHLVSPGNQTMLLCTPCMKPAAAKRHQLCPALDLCPLTCHALEGLRGQSLQYACRGAA